MTRIGILLAILGFGSVLLGLINVDFVLLSWADSMQPLFGLVLGVVGVAVLLIGFAMERKKEQQQAQPGELA